MMLLSISPLLFRATWWFELLSGGRFAERIPMWRHSSTITGCRKGSARRDIARGKISAQLQRMIMKGAFLNFQPLRHLTTGKDSGSP